MMILAHDLGTSGNKASLYTEEGELVASALAPYETHYAHNGLWAEQNPEDWWQAVCLSTRQIMAGRNPADVMAVAFSGQSMGCLCVDKNGVPLSHSIIWQDGRATSEAAAVVERVGGKQEACRLVGQQLTANYSLSKLMWIKANKPEIYKQTYKMLAAKDYMTLRMTGRFVTDHCDAAFMQAYDMSARTWSAKLIDAAGVDGTMFPEILESTDVAGYVTKQAAEDLGIASGIPVIVGSGDGPCAALGAGVLSSGDSYLCVGTSTWLSVLADKYMPDPEGRLQVYPFAAPGLYLLAGTMQAGGLSYSWARKQYFDPSTPYSEIDAAIENTPAGAGGVVYLPYLMGERSPWWNTKARGAFVGMSAETSRGHMLRSVLEGVAMNLQLICEDITRFTPFASEINIIGGGAKGGVWRQIIADVLQTTVRKTVTTDEATNFGAAIIAAVGVGLFPSFSAAKSLVKIDSVNKPNPENAALYKEKLEVFRDTYLALKPIFERIAK
jgi:xylulokinase